MVYKQNYSSNRFIMILKAIARGVKEKVVIYMPFFDEVGNIITNHPFIGLIYNEDFKSLNQK